MQQVGGFLAAKETREEALVEGAGVESMAVVHCHGCRLEGCDNCRSRGNGRLSHDLAFRQRSLHINLPPLPGYIKYMFVPTVLG